MKKHRRALIILVLFVLGTVTLINVRAGAPTASPTSPAIGTWKKGGLRYVLNTGGTGQQLLGRRHRFPLTWTEQNGVVSMIIKDPTSPEMEEIGQLSSIKRTLTITHSHGTQFPFRFLNHKSNWVLKKQ